MSAFCVIPARLESKRLPRKLLLNETGKPLLQHTWEAAKQATNISEVIIATDSTEIFAVAKRFGAHCVLTGEHPSGTDRIAEVAFRELKDASVIVNVQGDEPEINPRDLDSLVIELTKEDGREIQMATLAVPSTNTEDWNNSNCVKVVSTTDRRALYFSRAAIPCYRDQQNAQTDPLCQNWLRHIGVYAYRREFLIELSRTPPSQLELTESLEQLRAYELGAHIRLVIVQESAVGIDTADDYQQFVERYRSKS